jgi:hypothetical protein
MKAQVEILMGRLLPTRIPYGLAEAVESIEIRQTLTQRSTFQIVFRAQRTRASGDDYGVIKGGVVDAISSAPGIAAAAMSAARSAFSGAPSASPVGAAADLGDDVVDALAALVAGADSALAAIGGTVMPSVRTIVSVAAAGDSRVLMDGYITHLEVKPSDGPDQPTLVTVTGEDVSVRMDLFERSNQWPAMTDYLIVLAIIAKNLDLGLIPLAVPAAGGTLIPPNPLVNVPMQQGSDYQYLQQLAAKYGYVFRVSPGPEPFTNYAYWGPVVDLSPTIQPALTVGTGILANVDKMTFGYDALKPFLMGGEVYDETTGLPIPIITVPLPVDPFAARPPITIQPLFFRRRYRNFMTGGDAVKAYAYALGKVMASQQAVATASGRLDVFRYGAILRPYEAVGVRGAGSTCDGVYYVTDVTHQIRQGEYTQEFQLARGGLGTLVQNLGTLETISAEASSIVTSAVTAAESVVSDLPF